MPNLTILIHHDDLEKLQRNNEVLGSPDFMAHLGFTPCRAWITGESMAMAQDRDFSAPGFLSEHEKLGAWTDLHCTLCAPYQVGLAAEIVIG